jgi:hypothetical protein
MYDIIMHIVNENSGLGPVEGSCECGDETSGSIKCWEILEWQHNWRLLKKGSTP